MNYEFNVPLCDLTGNPIKDNGKDVTLGLLLANQLVSQPKGDALKFMSWAKKLTRCEVLNLDKSDVRKLRDFVEGCETMTILSKAPILEIIDQVRNDE
jgi:hypothetical protein